MRIEECQKIIVDKKISGFLIENPTDIFYLIGISLSVGRLFIDERGGHLFVDGRYYEACLRTSPVPVYRTEERGFERFLQKIKKGFSLGFDATYTSYKSFMELSELCGQKLSLLGMESPCLPLRMVKEQREIKAIKKAALLNAQAMKYASSLIKEGVLETEIASKIQIYFLKNGGEKIGFNPIVAFGPNAAECHYRPGKKRALKKGECVLIDMGVVVDHYHSDLTRTFFFGPPKKELKKAYDIVKRAVEAAFEKCRPHVTISDLDKAARSLIEREGYGEFFPHSLGHGVGLDIHESPRIRQVIGHGVPPQESTANRSNDDSNEVVPRRAWPRCHGRRGMERQMADAACSRAEVARDRLLPGEMTLKPGMVITIEPGIYLPKIGGIRLEELVLITEKGYENLTPKNLVPL